MLDDAEKVSNRYSWWTAPLRKLIPSLRKSVYRDWRIAQSRAFSLVKSQDLTVSRCMGRSKQRTNCSRKWKSGLGSTLIVPLNFLDMKRKMVLSSSLSVQAVNQHRSLKKRRNRKYPPKVSNPREYPPCPSLCLSLSSARG
jgi:hypothetical protein